MVRRLIHPLAALIPVLLCWSSTAQQVTFKKSMDDQGEGVIMTIGNDTVEEAKTLVNDWKFRGGDDEGRARPAYDDEDWKKTGSSLLELKNFSKEAFPGVGWFRREFTVDSAMLHRSFIMSVFQFGASEIYIDGDLKTRIGKVSPDPEEEEVNVGIFRPVPIQFSDTGTHHIAVRYSDAQAWEMMADYSNKNGTGFLIWMLPTEKFMELYNAVLKRLMPLLSLVLGVGATITVIHLLLFIFYREYPSNLYYSFYMGFSSSIVLIAFLLVISGDPHTLVYTTYYVPPLLPLIMPALLGVFYSVFYQGVSKFGIGLFGLALLATAMYFIHSLGYGILFAAVGVLSLVDIARVLLMAFIKKKPGTSIFGYTFLAVFLLILLLTIGPSGFYEENLLILWSGIASSLFLSFFVGIPVSMSVFLAWEFAATNRSLRQKLTEVRELSDRNLQHEREKQEIIRNQKEELEKKVEERTREVVQQKEELEEKNREITDSINYAKRIQDALLPPFSTFEEAFGAGFVLFKPQSIVSGDFYWIRSFGDKVWFAACDGTGHGVPGAFMSMIGNQLLNEVLVNQGETDPGKAFDRIRESLLDTLQKEGEGERMKDGMDAVLCVLDKKTRYLQGVGANNPLYIIRENIGVDPPPVTFHQDGNPIEREERVKPFRKTPHGLEIKGDKRAVGYEEGKDQPFTTFGVQLEAGDVLYTFSDGYADQFGGPKGKKFGYASFKQLLAGMADRPMKAQKATLEQSFEDWKEESRQEQVDDVVVIGVRVE